MTTHPVAAARAASGLSQAELATRAGLTESAVSRIERGVRVPRGRTRWSLAVVLGKPVSDLFPSDRVTADDVAEFLGITRERLIRDVLPAVARAREMAQH